jgi:hypothetical protein
VELRLKFALGWVVRDLYLSLFSSIELVIRVGVHKGKWMAQSMCAGIILSMAIDIELRTMRLMFKSTRHVIE